MENKITTPSLDANYFKLFCTCNPNCKEVLDLGDDSNIISKLKLLNSVQDKHEALAFVCVCVGWGGVGLLLLIC